MEFENSGFLSSDLGADKNVSTPFKPITAKYKKHPRRIQSNRKTGGETNQG